MDKTAVENTRNWNAITPISEEMAKRDPIGTYKKMFSYDWVFVGWEKIIVAGSFLWTLFCIVKFLIGLL